MHPADSLDERGITTLQYALKRGIEQVFQIEESELVAEPLPHRDKRRAILFYEAAEGGAGVLTRLASDANALAGVAQQALLLCHYETVDNWNTTDDTNKDCEAGCYRCLLSYYNQPDHELIDRRHDGALEVLRVLTRATVMTSHTSRHDALAHQLAHHSSPLSTHSPEHVWLDYVKRRGYRLPDAAQHPLDSFGTCPDYLYRDQQAVVYLDGCNPEPPLQEKLDESLTNKLKDAGLLVIRFPEAQDHWADIFAQYPDVFGAEKV